MTENEKIELLKKVDIFSKLRKKELEIVSKYSQLYNYEKNKTVFSQGSHKECLYIIKEGEVLISKKSGKKESVIASFIAGESFGELDLFDSTPKDVKAIADKKTTLLIFPKKGVKFKDVLEDHPNISAILLHKLLAIIAGRIRSTNKILSEKTHLAKGMREQLITDKLTGVYNRTFLDEDFQDNFDDYGETLSFLMIKPDNFKIINDTYGHEAGDAALMFIAKTFKSILGDENIPVRYRGDEFGAILPNVEKKSAIDLADKIRAKFNSINIKDITNGDDFIVKISAGVSTYPEHAQTSDKLIKRTFEKMFAAREGGGDRTYCD
ncbi:diguanylate cyclase domain-containing protein [Spirochaetota bacterium]